ncbi:MAG: Crp/Fnr family transcriptional regulator [Candidatus Poribacteria bacterium]|jgi:CRP/FNR family transcriptional regulator
MEKFWYLKHINIYQQLNEIEITALNRVSRVWNINRYEEVQSGSDTVYIVKSGKVKLCKPPEESETDLVEKLTIATVEKGEIFGEVQMDDGHENQLTVESLDITHLQMLSRYEFELLMRKNPNRCLQIRKWISRRKVENSIENVIGRSASSRLATVLAFLASKYGVRRPKSTEIRIRLSDENLARLIGIDQRLCYDLLEELKWREIIKSRWGWINLLNQWQLKKIASARLEEIELTKKEEERLKDEAEQFELSQPNETTPINTSGNQS